MSSKLSPKKRDTAAKLKKSDMDFYRMSAIFFSVVCGSAFDFKSQHHDYRSPGDRAEYGL